MTYTEKDIAKILRYGEHITLECKLAEGGLPKSLWETYSAFANTEDGTILLGIEENQREDDFNKRFVIKGVHSIRNLLKAFWDTILNLHPADIGELLGTMADKKKLLKKNYKGRWTTYTLNFDARLEDLPLFAQAQRDTLTVTPTDSNPLQGEAEGRQGKVTDKVTDKVKLLLKILAEKGELGAQDLLVGFNLSQIVNLHERYIRPALKTGLIERTQPDSPRSPTQKYRLTTKGRAYLEAMKGNG